MLYRILGIEKVDYVSKKTGQQVRGTNLHCCVGQPSDRVTGDAVERLYVPERVDCGTLQVTDEIEVFFNRYGSVDTVRLA